MRRVSGESSGSQSSGRIHEELLTELTNSVKNSPLVGHDSFFFFTSLGVFGHDSSESYEICIYFLSVLTPKQERRENNPIDNLSEPS